MKNYLLQSIISRLLMALLLSLSGPLMAANIDDTRLWRAPDHTRLVLDLSAAVNYQTFVLSNPARFVIDIQDTKYRRSVASKLKALDLSNAPIAKIRSAKRNSSDLRIVLELKSTVQARVFTLPANQQVGERLVVDLYDAQSAESTIKSATQRQGRRDIIIALDPGHGGEDPGALGPKKIREKAVVLAIAQKTQAAFNRRAGYRAVLIRDGDYYIGLSKRREKARAAQADFFISIHADAFTDKRVSGASVYTLSDRGASSGIAKHLAQEENKTDLIGGVSLANQSPMVASVLLDLSMNAQRDHSFKAGQAIVKRMEAVTPLHKKTVQHAAFAVLKTPDIPSVLVETGFISNPKEARRLASTKHQGKLAAAIVAGTTDFFNIYATQGTLVHWYNHGGKRSADSYTIQAGDTLSQLAQQFSVSLTDLRQYNSIQNDKIRVGQTLKIPPQQ
tara:strand:+ start:2467 stop:3810 length:1344 start_codon:yes stop_codon:yes gene_type:complete